MHLTCSDFYLIADERKVFDWAKTLTAIEIYEPSHDKTFYTISERQSAYLPAHSRRQISAFVIRCLDSFIL